MKRFVLWPADHPIVTAVAIGLITIVLAWQIPRLPLDTSTDGFIAAHDPDRDYYERFKEKFGDDSYTLVVIKAPDVFTGDVLSAVQRLSDALEQIDGVTSVQSLTTVQRIKGEADVLNTDVLVGRPVPTAPAELARMRTEALGNRALVGNIVSSAGTATAVVVQSERRRLDPGFSHRLSADVDRLVGAAMTPGITMYQIGGPLTDVTLGAGILDDLFTFIPVSFAVLFFFLFWAFRSLHGVAIPLLTAAVSTAWSLGLMSVFSLPLTLLTAIVPSILVVIGCTEDVHMLSEYHHLLRNGCSKVDAIRTMLERAALPVAVTSGTTIVGFGSLIVSPIPVQLQFGLAAALGLLANFVVTMTMVPVMLRLWPAPAHLGPEGEAPRLSRFLRRVGEFDLRRRTAIVVASALVVIGSLAGWGSLRVNTDSLSVFPEDSVIRARVRDLGASLTGFGAFSIVVETGMAGGISNPEVLRSIAGLQQFLEQRPEVAKTISAVDYVTQMHREMNNGNTAFEAVPDSADQVAQYLLVLEGKELARYVDFNGSTAHVLVRHHATGTWELATLLEALDTYLTGRFPPAARVRYTGEGILMRNAADYLAVSELASFSSTLVLIGVIHALFFQSLWAGLLSLVPNVIPVLFIFGVMGLLDIPLNLGTAMVATIAIGIAVDDTVHHVVTYRRQLREHGDRRIAMFNTMQAQGPPIIYISVALAAGFFVFAFSNFVPIVQFAVLSGLAMLIALAGELVLTPLIMYSTSPEARDATVPAPFRRSASEGVAAPAAPQARRGPARTP